MINPYKFLPSKERLEAAIKQQERDMIAQAKRIIELIERQLKGVKDD